MLAMSLSPNAERSAIVNPVNSVEALPAQAAGNTEPSLARKGLEGVTTMGCGYSMPIIAHTSAGHPGRRGDEIVCSCGTTARSQDKEPDDNTKEVRVSDHQHGRREPQLRGHRPVMDGSKAGELLETYSLVEGQGNQQPSSSVTVRRFRDHAEYALVRVETRTSPRPQEHLGEDMVRHSSESRRAGDKEPRQNQRRSPGTRCRATTCRAEWPGFLHGLSGRHNITDRGVPCSVSCLNKQGELLEPYSHTRMAKAISSLSTDVVAQAIRAVADSETTARAKAVTAARVPCPSHEGEDIVRHSLETRRAWDKEPRRNRCVVGQAKGNIPRGSDVWNSRTGHPDRFNHTNDVVAGEVIFVEATGTTVYAAVLAYRPLKPGTISITEGANTWVDNGNGVLSGTNLASGTINYQTGEVNATITAATNGLAVTAQYQFDIEGNDTIPQLDFQLTSSPVFAQERKLRGRWSTEAAQVLQALHGLDAEAQVTTAIANEIQFNNTDWLRSNAHAN